MCETQRPFQKTCLSWDILGLWGGGSERMITSLSSSSGHASPGIMDARLFNASAEINRNQVSEVYGRSFAPQSACDLPTDVAIVLLLRLKLYAVHHA